MFIMNHFVWNTLLFFEKIESLPSFEINTLDLVLHAMKQLFFVITGKTKVTTFNLVKTNSFCKLTNTSEIKYVNKFF